MVGRPGCFPRALVDPCGTKEPIELTSKRGGREVHWTTPSLIELGMRKWAGQRIQAMAVDFGVSLRTITSQLHWLEIPSRPRREQTDHFDRAAAEANIQGGRLQDGVLQVE